MAGQRGGGAKRRGVPGARAAGEASALAGSRRRGDAAPGAVVFDLGGVLLDWNPRHLYRKLFPGDPDGMERFLGSVCTPAWNARQDRGRPFAEAIEELSRDHPRHAGLIAAYFERWPEMIDGAIRESVDVLAELRARGVPLYALSNWSAETYPLVRDRFAFLSWFRGVVISGEEGVAKPDPEIYGILCARFGLRPDDAVFVDDSPANVESARRLGFHAEQFRGAAGLRGALETRGLLARRGG